VAAGYEQYDRGIPDSLLFQIGAAQVTAEVIDSDNGNTPAGPEPGSRIEPHQQWADQSRAPSNANSAQLTTVNAGLGQGSLDRRDYGFYVSPARELRVDTTEWRMHMNLRSNNRREDATLTVDDSCRRIITGGLDSQN
jgi:hypothetical protein